MTTRLPGSAAAALLASSLAAVAGDLPRAPTVADAIAMVRIQHSVSVDGRVVSVSPDGAQIAAVFSRGDAARNVNVYSLCVIDVAAAVARHGAGSRCPLSIDFPGDPEDQDATPIRNVAFLGDGRRLSFIGRMNSGPAQVYVVDIQSGVVTPATNSADPVRSYASDAEGRVRVFSAAVVDPDDEARVRRNAAEGAFVFDRDAYPRRLRFLTATIAGTRREPRLVRQHYLASPDAGAAKLLFDSRAGISEDETTISSLWSLSADSGGRYALIHPFVTPDGPVHPERYRELRELNAFARSLAWPYGLVELATGIVAPLLGAPGFPFSRAHAVPVWSPTGASVLVYTFLPVESPGFDGGNAAAQWVEVDVATRRATPLGLGDGWQVVAWRPGDVVIAMRGGAVGQVRRGRSGGWQPLEMVGESSGLNVLPSWFAGATNGRYAFGVKEDSTEPPELAAYDLTSGKTHVLTDLNPQLRTLRHGAVEEITWPAKFNLDSSGFLIKPLDYASGRRYPLVVLLDDGILSRGGRPYLLDAAVQSSGHAIQMLSAAGFVVLYARQPRARRTVIETPAEGEFIREHVESGIAHLDRLGLVDTTRVGISGWSRDAYSVAYILVHSAFRYAAASMIDGGTSEYNERLRPWWDGELANIRAPLLLEAHGSRTLASHAWMADRLDAFGKAVELLYFATAPHSVITPKHRDRSLTAHVDWWRFWLKGERDPDPGKEALYARWEALRTPHP